MCQKQQQRVREVREVSSASKPDEGEKMKPLGGVRRSALILRNSTLSMFSSSRFSSASELELQDLHCSRQLTVLKIIICDILFSLADHVTDLVQGLNLLYGDLHSFEATAFHLTDLENYWREK